jgi:RNA polymerase sigma-70 factor (ECF subfamily)
MRGVIRLRATDADSAAAAYRALMEAELERSYRLAAVILRDPIDAEDAVHDAAVAAWRSWHVLRDEASGPAWFQRIVVNKCRDRLRRRRRRSLLEFVGRPMERDEPATTSGSDRAADADLVRFGLRRLSADERVAVMLRYAQDMTVPQIAALLEIPEGTVKSRLHHALGKLRAAMQEENA